MKPIVTDIYDFPTLIGGGYVYVDKTAHLRRMVSGVDGRFFFMSRPRRFGKSLMISTLEQIFRGNKKLFRGLDIARTDYDWKKYPVIRLDMSALDATVGASGASHDLSALLVDKFVAAGLEVPNVASSGTMLGLLIDGLARLSESGKVVVLIDEYDSPIAGLLSHPTELERMRSSLQSFYRVLKSRAEQIRFLMMTGVSKFTKLSVFSGMNNLTDISMSPVYASLLGYTREEVKRCFKPQVKAFSVKLKKPQKCLVDEILVWYDSYRFSPASEVRVCNPVSVGRALQEQNFYGFWNATGNASLIIERLRMAHKVPFDLDGILVRPEQLDVCDVKRLPMEALLYQGGYLTIDRQEPSGLLRLRVPNREVRQSLDSGYVAELLKDQSDEFVNRALSLVPKLDDSSVNAANTVRRVMTAVFAMVPHEWRLKNEAEAKRYFLLFMRMAGATINAEVESANGRADAILETEGAIYIFEFKCGKTAKAALRQIGERGYARPYAADSRSVVAFGINYNVATSKIEVDCGTVKRSRGTVKDGTVKAECLLAILKEHPGVRRPELQQLTGWSIRTVSRVLAEQSSNVEFRGAPKTGGYFIR